MRKENRPFAHSRGRKPICWKAKAYILWLNGSVEPGSAGGEGGRQKVGLNRKNIGERSEPSGCLGRGSATLSPSTDYLSARFARLLLFSPTPIFSSSSPRCGAWSQANWMVISFVCLFPARLLLSTTAVLYHVNNCLKVFIRSCNKIPKKNSGYPKVNFNACRHFQTKRENMRDHMYYFWAFFELYKK